MFSKVSDIFSTDKVDSIIKFKDRESAGNSLSDRLKNKIEENNSTNTIVLGIPRGGVVVANIIAKKLRFKLDIVIPRKLVAPYNEELGIGAIMKDGTIYLDNNIIAILKISKEYIEKEKERQKEEIIRREAVYKKQIDGNSIKNKTIILVDDGAATGATLIVASRWIKKFIPKKLVIALTVAPKTTYELLKREADSIESLNIPSNQNFSSVGKFYQDFLPVEDDIIKTILSKYQYDE